MMILRFLSISLAALLCSGCGPSTPERSGPPPAPVQVAEVRQADVPVELTAIGTVDPVATVQLKPKTGGEILEVLFADGAAVREGDLLFRIDLRTYQSALNRAIANLEITQSGATVANEQAQRYTTLSRRGVASEEQFSQIQSAATAREAELDARRADVEDARLRLEWTEVRSPVTGRAGVALLKPGNLVQANTDTLVVINQMQPIYVTFALPESALNEVRRWMKEGRPLVTVFDPTTRRELGTGELTFVDNAVDRTSGMVAFKATFPNENEFLWPGQFVDVVLRLYEEKNATIVPTIAVMEGQSGPQVFVVENDGTARLQRVDVTRTRGDQTVIASGVEPGQKVVTVGQLRVSPGGKVAVRNPEPAKP